MTRLFPVYVLGLLLGGSLLCAASPVSAQTWTAEVWAPYTDRYGLIHDKEVTSENPTPSNNGLLYTAEACVIMQLSNVSYDKGRIAAGVDASQVKRGLFGRGPSQLRQQQTLDDYIGLGALAGVCGFQGVARDILNYGTGGDQSTPAGLSSADFAELGNQLQQCKTVNYNYNNVDPGKVTKYSWMGRYPDVITHLKIAAGDVPSVQELAVWGAELISSGKKGTNDRGDMNPWLLSWLMVLTYGMSNYHSPDADYAVVEWWKMLHARFPESGIKQAMTEYLSEGAKHPLAKYIDDFEHSKNPRAVIANGSNDAERLLGRVETILSTSCGSGARTPCIDFNNFLPVNFLSPFSATVTTSSNALSGAQLALAGQQKLIENQAAAVERANVAIAGLTKNIVDFQARHVQLLQQVANAGLDKANMIAKGLDKLHIPAHFRQETRKVFGKTVPVGPPILVPGSTTDSPGFAALVNSIAGLENEANDVLNKISQAQQQLQSAQQRLVDRTNEFIATKLTLKPVIDRLQDELTKAKEANEEIGRDLVIAQGIAENISNPCASRFTRRDFLSGPFVPDPRSK